MKLQSTLTGLGFALALLISTASSPAQSTWTVTTSAGFASAVAAATPGDTLAVHPGIYSAPGGLVINKDIVVRSVGGPLVTFISGASSHTALRISNVGPGCILDGFTIQDGVGAVAAPLLAIRGEAGGLHMVNASLVVRHCVIQNNRGGNGVVVQVNPGTIYMSYIAANAGPGAAGFDSGNPVFQNCVIANNVGGNGALGAIGYASASAATGGIGTLPPASASLVHCTVTGNVAGTGPLTIFGPLTPAGGIDARGPFAMGNSIVWGNSLRTYGLPVELAVPSSAAVIYSDVHALDTVAVNVGNIDVDPHFAAPALNDFRLAAGSPCIDVGFPGALPDDIEGRTRPQYLRPDMGAYEWAPPPTLALGIVQPNGPLDATVAVSGGTAGAQFVTLLTTDPANAGPGAGNGRWGGLFMSEAAVGLEIGTLEPPFVGTFDALGTSSAIVPLPPGLTGITLFGVSHALQGTTAALLSARSPVVTHLFL